MSGFAIEEAARPAAPGDHDVIRHLAEAARAEALAKRGGTVLVERDLPPSEALDAADEVIVGTIDGIVVGYATVWYEALRIGDPLAVIDEIYVLPDARGVGVGEAMMDVVVEQARARGCRGVASKALPGDRETKNFFETFGLVARLIEVFRPLGEGRSDTGARPSANMGP